MTQANNFPISDADLVATLPGFVNRVVEVNGTKIHFVEGGSGNPLVLLPGWPQTWWQFSRILLPLAKQYRVLAVDLRGMGGSSKPASGYDKKNMAKDIADLVELLQLGQVNIAGNDIGSMVAYAFAANYPEKTRNLVMMDAPHPFAVFRQIPVLVPPVTYDLESNPRNIHPWWFAFHNISSLPAAAFEGNYDKVQNWLFDYLAFDKTSITPQDRAVYAAAYNGKDAIDAVGGWFSSFWQDVDDAASYAPLSVPVLGLGGFSYDFLAAFLATAAPNATLVKLPETGHWIPDEKPEETVQHLTKFFG